MKAGFGSFGGGGGGGLEGGGRAVAFVILFQQMQVT